MTKQSIPTFNLLVNGVEYESQLAKVTHYNFEDNDHGGISDNIVFEGAGWGQGFGGYVLDQYDPISKERVGTAYGMDFILGCIKQLGTIGTTGQQVLVFRKANQGWGGKIEGFVRVNSDGSYDQPFFPDELRKKHFPDKESN